MDLCGLKNYLFGLGFRYEKLLNRFLCRPPSENWGMFCITVGTYAQKLKRPPAARRIRPSTCYPTPNWKMELCEIISGLHVLYLPQKAFVKGKIICLLFYRNEYQLSVKFTISYVIVWTGNIEIQKMSCIVFFQFNSKIKFWVKGI